VTATAGPRRLASRLYAILGVPGLTIALFSILSLGFGLYVLAREYDRLRVSGRAALRPVISNWVRSTPVHYLGQTIGDYADNWRRSPVAEREARLIALRRGLESLGETLEGPRWRTPLLHIEGLDLVEANGTTVATWRPGAAQLPAATELSERVLLSAASSVGPELDLIVSYRFAPDVERVAVGLENSYHRLLLGLVGLSAYSLLCLAAMVLHVRALRDRVAHEAAQQATLDLADRTCHELGNVAFVLANERRNLNHYLDLVSRFVAEIDGMIDTAAKRAGLSDDLMERLRGSLNHRYAELGIDPALELHDGAKIAREVCRQIAVCSDYIALTIRELDAYLKQSELPVVLGPIDVPACVDDALALLAPAIASTHTRVERIGISGTALGDRRLLVHALVNVLKNALEATTSRDVTAVISLAIRRDDEWVWIDVTDNGPGISPEKQAKIFEPGFSTKSPGRGRGLAVVRDSIASQNGQIRVESEPGRGTLFSIGLPKELAAVSEQASRTGAASTT
jgi:signal transduction histidine kinase